jgi:coenzyme F420 hydrogenase subunit beta
MQRQTDERAARIKLLIGLMCSQTYTYEGLIVNHIQNTLGINLNDIQKIDIKHQMIISTKTGQTTIPLKNLQKYARKPCQTCSDFSSEQADISTGSLGLQHSTFTIIRTRTGEQAFNRAEQAHALTTRPVQNDEPSLKLLQKLSQQKHQRPDTT